MSSSADPTDWMDVARFEIRLAMDGRYRWRLLGDNNRTLAISAGHFPNRQSCMDDALRVALAARDCAPALDQRGSSAWAWVLTASDGSVVAHSAGTYPRRSECRRAMIRATGAFLAARAGTGSGTGIGSGTGTGTEA
jgi:uncharacterized protein YegP (UPF0339 family)